MRPLYERVLIKPREKETETESGILIPQKSVKRPNVGTVVAVGDGSSNNEMKVKEGDLVICNRYAGVDLKYKGETHYIVMVNEIMAVLDNLEYIELDEFE
jgi:chaperonin GroES